MAGVIDVVAQRATGELLYVAGAIAATSTAISWKRDGGGATLKPGDRIQIVLHGDFVLDECGHPLDAAHVGGHLPSGGAGGGDFLSWFTIAP
jgi:hypothetical protein